MKLSSDNLLDLAVGAAFLGTGGGGDPYIGRLMVQRCLDDGLSVEVMDADTCPDDALVIPTAMMGAPTVLVEKIPSGEEAVKALQHLEKYLGKKAFATMPIEIGGINSTIPLMVAARLGIPVIDADGMGRAFPELQMETFSVYGISACPMVVSNEHGDRLLIEARDNRTMEWYARGATIRMGGCAYIAEYSMTGAEMKRTSIKGTLTLAMKIGNCLRLAKSRHENPFEALFKLLPQTPYSYGKIIFKGKVVDLRRETKAGFSVGKATIASEQDPNTLMEIEIQNENLIARVGREVYAIVPDLICTLDSESAEPITTENLRYGQRVTIVAVSVPEIMRTPEALDVFGPQAFGLAETFSSILTQKPAHLQPA